MSDHSGRLCIKGWNKSVSTTPATNLISKFFLHSSILQDLLICFANCGFSYTQIKVVTNVFHIIDYLVFENPFISPRKCVQYAHWSKKWDFDPVGFAVIKWYHWRNLNVFWKILLGAIYQCYSLFWNLDLSDPI